MRTGWYSNQPALSPASVAAPDFGQLFVTQLNGQIYAQPLLANGVVLVVTETNNIYTLDPVSGAVLAQRTLETPWNASDIGCADLAPTVGITGTPVIDTRDSANVTAYFVTKGYLSGTSGPAGAWMHAVDVPTLSERPNFPVRIQGSADNQSGVNFDGTYQIQRPAMLMLGDTVYAAFAGHCDLGTYYGWVIGVSSAGAIKAMWSDANAQFPGGGIWQSGGGPASDGPSTMIVATGNGDVVDQPTPGHSPPPVLGQAWVRLNVQGNGKLQAVDYFSPYDAASLNTWDADFGSGGPMLLPDSFGTAAIPHLGVAAGKQGYVYLLNRDDLGGMKQGPSGGDKVVQRIGPYGGVWSRPAVWPGSGGWVYYPAASGGTTSEGSTGNLNVFSSGLDGQGNPTLSLVAMGDRAFGFGSSAPVVTSNGMTDGSAVVWVVWMGDGSGQNAQLLAYDAVTQTGTLQPVFNAAVGTASKFNPPGIGDGRVYVGTRDGNLYAFGAPANQPLSSSPVDLGTVDLGGSTSGQVVFTAKRNVTVTGVTSSSADFVVPSTPATLATGQTLTVPVTFTPTRVGIRSAAIIAQTDSGPVSTTVTGVGRRPTAVLSLSPQTVSFGGAPINQVLSTTVTIANVGGAGLVINGVTAPGSPFSASGMPPAGTMLAPNTSVTVTVTFAPTVVGMFTDEMKLDTSAGPGHVPVSGTAALPGNLVVSPNGLFFGTVPVGQSKTMEFQVQNTGGSRVEVTKSKPPATGVGFTALDNLQEGAGIDPGQTVTLHVQFKPTKAGSVNDQWTINANGEQGLITLSMSGEGQGGTDPAKGCSTTGGVPLWPLGVLVPLVLRRRRDSVVES
jgi:iron transport multicopper oxidase